jgi:Zn ribbon nucleic-acid-binding protein
MTEDEQKCICGVNDWRVSIANAKTTKTRKELLARRFHWKEEERFAVFECVKCGRKATIAKMDLSLNGVWVPSSDFELLIAKYPVPS